MSSDLVSFLRARLDEDERIAVGAHYGRAWHPVLQPVGTAERHHVRVESETDFRIAEVPQGSLARRNAIVTHIARHDPASILADIKAKRAILGLLEDAEASAELSADAWQVLKVVARIHAASHASHPAYDEKWTP